jgi:predicted nucleotidyltransferase
MKKLRREVSLQTRIDRERIIATSRAHQAELHRHGVRHPALFGSIARGEGKRTSDIDILSSWARRRLSASSNTLGLHYVSRTSFRAVSK